MMAIVSKAVFDKESPGAKVGDVLPLAVYRSAHKAFEKLDDKSRLFLVTVRPPDEKLWLVGVLEGLKFDGKQWNSKPNARAVTDISHLQSVLKFDSGKGITATKGQLGMSLQTPRVLTAQDADALLGAAGGPSKPSAVAAPPGMSASIALRMKTNITAHEESPVLPCLCKKCLHLAPDKAVAGGMDFVRTSVDADSKVLHFWMPRDMRDDLNAITQSVRSALTARAK